MSTPIAPLMAAPNPIYFAVVCETTALLCNILAFPALIAAFICKTSDLNCLRDKPAKSACALIEKN